MAPRGHEVSETGGVVGCSTGRNAQCRFGLGRAGELPVIGFESVSNGHAAPERTQSLSAWISESDSFPLGGIRVSPS